MKFKATVFISVEWVFRARDQEPLVVDWRAPVAEPFYRATGRFPMGLSRRRHFSLQGRTLIGIEDEPLVLSGDANDELRRQLAKARFWPPSSARARAECKTSSPPFKVSKTKSFVQSCPEFS